MAKKVNKHLKPLTNTVDFGEIQADSHILRDMWWLLLMRGILLVLFGMFAILWPGITLLVLATIFGIYLLSNGFVDVVVGIRSIGHTGAWFMKVLLGILEIVVGVYVIDRGQLLVVATFILLLGLLILFQGIVDLVSMFRTSRDTGRRLWLLLAAVLSIVVGLILLRQPVTGALAFTWVLGFYGIFGGALTIGAALSMRTPKAA